MPSIIDVLRRAAEARPGARAYTFLRDGEHEAAALTFTELDRLSTSAAHRLIDLGLAPGSRALLLYPQGLDFIVAFFACLKAGIAPVPVSAPGRRGDAVIRAIADDSGAAAVLTAASMLASLENGSIPAHATDAWPADRTGSIQFTPGAQDIALVQYTSGSTGTPRGVVVTHANLLDNMAQVEAAFGHDSSTVIVTWLPMFHDMGLGTVLQAVWLGAHCVLMSPNAFLQKPLRWLRAISRYHATTSGGPDFAYDLAARRVTAAEREGLNLSSWRVAYNGAEPVRAATLERFGTAFAPCGFRRESFHPVYGMAEATLFVASESAAQTPVVAEHGGLARVSCGRAWGHTRLAIVDPETRARVEDGKPGEIWIAGASVAAGYWRRPEETAATFSAITADGDGPFLRSGDIGVSIQGRLYVTGRLKDLIIVRGRNLYPADIEDTVGAAHDTLAPGATAAFSIEAGGEERLVVVQEVRRDALRALDAGAVVRAIRAAISEEHGVAAHAIALIKPATLLRTTSGKVRRGAMRDAYLANALSLVDSWVFWSGADAPPAPEDATGRVPVDDTIAWIRQYAARRINSHVIDERRMIPPYVVLDFGNHGLLGMLAPREAGGLGYGHQETARVIEQLAAIDLTLCLFAGLNNYLGLRPIMRHAAKPLRERIVPRVASGRELAAFALTEAGAGSNPRAIAARAESDGPGRWRLFGTKVWIGSAAWAGVINIFARHEDGSISGFVVPESAPGLNQGPEALTMGMRGMIQNRIDLDGVPVTSEQLLGEYGRGMDAAQDAMTFARLAIAAASVGAIKRCAQLGLRYASAREISTGRLIAHPVTLARLGAMSASATALEALVRAAAAAADAGKDVAMEIFAACKIAGPELLWHAADDLMQLLGGRGYLEPNAAPQIMRDARVLRIFEGPTETMAALVGARALSHTRELGEAIEGLLGSPDGASRLAMAIDEVRGLALPVHAAQARAGMVAAAAIVYAAAETAARREPSAARQRAAAWALDELARAQAGEPARIPDVSTISDEVSGFTTSIGDIRQTLGGEDHDMDAMLASSQAPSPLPLPSPAPLSAPSPAPLPVTPRAEEIAGWLKAWLAKRVGVSADSIEPSRSFADQGLDSVTAVELAQSLSEWVGRPLDHTILWNYSTIASLSAHLAAPVPTGKIQPGRISRNGDIDEELRELERLLGGAK